MESLALEVKQEQRLIKLISMAELEEQYAVETLEKGRFVDDLLGGDETREGVDKTLCQSQL